MIGWLRPLKLLLPALVPAWNFFDWIAPSPRIEYALTTSADMLPEQWHEFRPRPQRVSALAVTRGLFFNAHWNESLFLVSCAERLCQHADAHSEAQIFQRIANDLSESTQSGVDQYLQFRLIFVSRTGDRIDREIAYQSAARTTRVIADT